MVIFTIGGAGYAVASHAASITTGEPPMGLMIQVSSLSSTITPAKLKSYLDSVRKDHRNPNKPGYINVVVLQDIADQNGNLLTTYLDILKPYLPGGSTPAFDRAYIGTIDLPWTGSGSKYIQGIEDPNFRSLNISQSTTLAKAFKTGYPTVKADWYITYEANLAGFWDSNIETSYVTYINQLEQALSGVSSSKAFMWSPAFWSTYTSVSNNMNLPSLQANLKDLFAKIPSPFYLDLQDFVGQSDGVSTEADALTWINYVHQLAPQLAGLQMNVEQFKQNPDGSIVVGDPIEVPARENYYVKNGIQLGPSWEIRYWHQRLYGN
ncbi:MAG TPA: hypothetical protein VH234_05140 [Candidatus Saccharimonadales bacterium]|nr:hypothetical protein [Candidatus Saccharimonadales bacterium]